MSNFASIDDLLKKDEKSDGQATGKKPSLSMAEESVAEKFQKKMVKISEKEKEREAMRRAAQIGFPHIDLEKFPVSHEALRQLPKEEAERLQAVCFFASPDEVRIGALDPTKEEVQNLLHELEERNRANGAVYTISEDSLKRILELYKTLPQIKPVSKDVEIKEEDLEKVQANVNDFHTLQELVEKKTITDILTFVLGAALKLESSDVHIEAEDKDIVVRFRMDGILHDAVNLPKEAYKKLVSRIKLVASLKINITDKPQDGRFTIKLKSGDVDVRVSTIPTVFGESIVMRLLPQDREGITLEELGVRGDAFIKLKKEIERPNGMVITTGPTGSGKTTTLYAIMQILNKPGVKIITLEDPVEYKMEGINQSQMERGRDYTFAKGLKSMLRQDPDIAMVGEIRDLETADTAIQAALTGHLILSTVHTNSAAGAVPRFLSMGVKPFLLAPALNAVIGQRLVRRICDDCKEKVELTAEQAERVKQIVESMPEKEKTEVNAKELVFYHGKGCETCNGLGYKGRIGIYEVFVVGEELEGLILSGHVSEFDIEKVAIAQGMVTMLQDGILKALDGITAVEEVFRVIE